jgi:hypothetical protein
MNAVSPVLAADDEATNTPGVFFHGSPECDLEQFRSQFDVTGAGRRGVYFTHVPYHAMIFAFGRNREFVNGKPGRIYTVDLVTRSELAATQAFWDEYWSKPGNEVGRSADELILEQAAIANRHDCIVTGEIDGHIGEIIVVEPSVIRPRTKMGAPLAEAARAIASGIFHAVDDAPTFEDGDYPLLFSSRRRAQEAGGTVRQVVVETGVSFYCDSDAWPLLDLEALQLDLKIDCLVDPVTGDALSLTTTELKPLNRTERRIYLKMKKQRR